MGGGQGQRAPTRVHYPTMSTRARTHHYQGVPDIHLPCHPQPVPCGCAWCAARVVGGGAETLSGRRPLRSQVKAH